MGRGWVHGVREAAGAKKGKLFTKLAKEIAVAVKTGGSVNPEANARLRSALKEAREHSMPRDTIDRAIKRGSGGAGEVDFEEITYEGYGPHGVAVLVETLTDNKNRTVQDLRAQFVRNQGSMAEPGAVHWMFERIGSVLAQPQKVGVDAEEAAIMVGANEVEAVEGNKWHFISAPTDLDQVQQELSKMDWTILKSELSYKSKNPMELNDAQEKDLKEFLEAIEDNDDVKRIHLSI